MKKQTSVDPVGKLVKASSDAGHLMAGELLGRAIDLQAKIPNSDIGLSIWFAWDAMMLTLFESGVSIDQLLEDVKNMHSIYESRVAANAPPAVEPIVVVKPKVVVVQRQKHSSKR